MPRTSSAKSASSSKSETAVTPVVALSQVTPVTTAKEVKVKAVKSAKETVETSEKPAKVKAVKSVKTKEPVVEVSTATVVASVPETPAVVSEVVSPGGTRSRREVTPESVDAEFTAMLEDLSAEASASKEAGRPANKFQRALAKRLEVLQRDTRRLTTRKRRNVTGTPKANVSSGIMRESRITPELAKFLGVAPETRMSRVQCTRLLNDYINSNKLKLAGDGREIVPNKDLTKLLGYDQKKCVDLTPNKAGKPKNPDGKLYYWVIQQLIQRHFVSETN